MKISWILYADIVATAFPLLSGLVARRRLTPPRRWIQVWSATLVAANVVAMVLGRHNRNNHWLTYLVTPIAGAFTLLAFSHWQKTARGARTMRLGIPVLWILWVGLVLGFEDTHTFSLLAEPVASLLILAASIYTLTSRATNETGNPLRQDWLWVALGIALYSGVAVALPPASNWLLTRHPELVMKAYEVKAVVEIAALLLISRGMVCPIPTSPFGGSLSPASSPSSSSSSASSSPW